MNHSCAFSSSPLLLSQQPVHHSSLLSDLCCHTVLFCFLFFTTLFHFTIKLKSAPFFPTHNHYLSTILKLMILHHHLNSLCTWFILSHPSLFLSSVNRGLWLQSNPYQITLQLIFKLHNKTHKISIPVVLPHLCCCITCIHASVVCKGFFGRMPMYHAKSERKTDRLKVRQKREGER